MTRLSADRYRALVASDLARLDVLLGDDPDWQAAVPGCPDWDLAALVRHVSGVQDRVAETLAGRRPRPLDGPGPADAELPAVVRGTGTVLLAALAGDPAAEVWSFDPADRTAGFWLRRQAMEQVVHRVDAESALGARTPVPADHAADGVDEVFDVLVRLRLDAGVFTLPDRAVAFVATDTGDRWVLGAGEVVATVSATAEDLFLTLWKRAAADLAVDGDAGAARDVLALALTP